LYQAQARCNVLYVDGHAGVGLDPNQPINLSMFLVAK
jgi:prepilin-type processing-associated H-X9-DG protein